MSSLKRRNFIIIAVVSAVILLPLLYAMIMTSLGFVTIGSLGCEARIERITEEQRGEVASFEKTAFLPQLANGEEFETRSGGDCVSNPASVRSAKTYSVNTTYGEVIDALKETLPPTGFQFSQSSRGLIGQAALCGDNNARFSLVPIVASENDGVFDIRENYSITASFEDAACDYDAAETSLKFVDEATLRTLPVQKIRIDQVLHVAS